MTIESQEQLEELGKQWQQRLRLQHWRLRFVLAKAGHDIAMEYSGQCREHLDLLDAGILIMRAEDAYKETFFPYDMEQTLVHELLHLWFSPYMADKDQQPEKHTAQEQTINTLADVLVELSRERWDALNELEQLRKHVNQLEVLELMLQEPVDQSGKSNPHVAPQD